MDPLKISCNQKTPSVIHIRLCKHKNAFKSDQNAPETIEKHVQDIDEPQGYKDTLRDQRSFFDIW